MKKQNNVLLAAALAIFAPGVAAGPPDTEAVEFYNASTNHYFITATASEARIVDTGGAGPGWLRTGRTFQAWLQKSGAPADAQPVCRFYSFGANSHFYTAGREECESLKASRSGWVYEGVSFYVQTPVSGRCPGNTVELLRVYNNGFFNGEGSNHRFVDDVDLADLMVDDEWIPEGVVFCAAAKSTGTNAAMRPTAASFDNLAGTWQGEGKFQVEEDGVEAKTRAPLEFTFDEEGRLGGEGYGCAFTGEATRGDGFRAFFMGTVTAAGCDDPAFDGEYARVKLQRFGDDTLVVHLKRGDAGVETKIKARLRLEGSTPDARPPRMSLEGDWAGTVRWEARSGDLKVEANKPLALSVSGSGAVTGEGFGCTFSGTVGGDIEAAGCEQALFNGAYRLALRRDGRSPLLKVALERKVDGTKAEIAGRLFAADDASPPPPAADPVLIGNWEGPVHWRAGDASGTDTLRFTIGSDGQFEGTALGCTLTGTLDLAMASRTLLSGSIEVSGCVEPALNGTFTDVKISREGHDALEFELEGKLDGVKVKLKARVRRTG